MINYKFKVSCNRYLEYFMSYKNVDNVSFKEIH